MSLSEFRCFKAVSLVGIYPFQGHIVGFILHVKDTLSGDRLLHLCITHPPTREKVLAELTERIGDPRTIAYSRIKVLIVAAINGLLFSPKRTALSPSRLANFSRAMEAKLISYCRVLVVNLHLVFRRQTSASCQVVGQVSP